MNIFEQSVLIKVYLQKCLTIIFKLPFGVSVLSINSLLVTQSMISSFCEAFLFLLRDNSNTSDVLQDSSALYRPMAGESFVLIFHLKRL